MGLARPVERSLRAGQRGGLAGSQLSRDDTARGGHRVGAGRGEVARTTEGVVMIILTSPDALGVIQPLCVDDDHDVNIRAVANVN